MDERTQNDGGQTNELPKAEDLQPAKPREPERAQWISELLDRIKELEEFGLKWSRN